MDLMRQCNRGVSHDRIPEAITIRRLVMGLLSAQRYETTVSELQSDTTKLDQAIVSSNATLETSSLSLLSISIPAWWAFID